jgi:hypothetical protein
MYSGGGGALVKREVQEQWLRGSGSAAHVLVATPVSNACCTMNNTSSPLHNFNSLKCSSLRRPAVIVGQGRLRAHCSSGAVKTDALRMYATIQPFFRMHTHPIML